jgi:hypothetical protein
LERIMRTFQHSQDFTDAGDSDYAAEVVYLLNSGASTTAPKTAAEYAPVTELLINYRDIGTSTLIKVEALFNGTTWRAMLSLDTAGLYEKVDLLGMRGVRIRALSQGDADTASIDLAWR